MIKILFICHGNICRSPMAEYIFKDIAAQRGLSDSFHIESAAISYEEQGNPIYPPARRILAEHGITGIRHQARRIERADYKRFDYLIAMEQYHLRNMDRILGGDPDGKFYRMLDFTDHPGNIDDPWYTDDFETAYEQIYEGCEGLMRHLKKEGSIWY